MEDSRPTSIPATDFDVKHSNAEETPGIFGEMRSETHPAVISVNGMSVHCSTPVEFDQHDNKFTTIMKLKLNATMSTLGLTIATLALTACGNSGDGSHNMGDNRNYKPMLNREMPNRN